MFGFNPSTFSDPFDVNKPLGTDNRERAKLKSQTFLTDSQLGGAATGIFARNKAEDIMAKANASAQRSQQNASTFGGIMGPLAALDRLVQLVDLATLVEGQILWVYLIFKRLEEVLRI